MIYNLGRVVPIFKGDYNSTTTYNFLDVVFYDNSSFVALDTTTGNLPTDTTHWLPVALKGTTQNPTPAQMQEIISAVETYITTNTIVDNLKSTETDKSLSANQGNELSKRSHYMKIVGNGNTIAASNKIYVLNGHKYRIYPNKTNPDTTGVSTTVGTFFAVIAWNYDNTNDTVIYSIPTTQMSSGLAEYYEFTSDRNGLWEIRMRVAVGETVDFSVEDVSYIKEIDSKVNNLVFEVNDNFSERTIVSPTNSTPTRGRLLQDGTVYQYGSAWRYFIYNLETTKKYVCNLSVIGTTESPTKNYCGVQYFNSSDEYLGYEVVFTTSKYNIDFYLTPPSGATYCYIQTAVDPTVNPTQLWTYDYYDLGSEFEAINNQLQYNKDLPFTMVSGGGSIDYSNGGTIGTLNGNSGWVYVEGLTSIRYARMRMNSTTNMSGMAFYTSKSTSGYISGQRGITGASTGGYVDTFIDVPPTAVWARFSIWVDNLSFYVKDGNTEYLNYDTVNEIVDEAIDNADLDVKVLEGKKVSVIGDSISCFGTQSQTQNSGYNAPYFIIKSIDVGQQIQSYITWLDVYTTVDSTTLRNQTIGGTPLTAAMIGTLQTFTPTSEDVGKCLGIARWAGSYTTKPWWKVLIDKSGATLCNNASWSGSRIVEIPEGNSRHDAFVLSEAYSEYTLNRICNRDDAGNTIVPDVVLIYRGTNDLVGIDPEGGTGTLDVESLETPNMLTWDESNFNTHNFTEGYIHTILELRRKYPNIYIILCTLNVFKRSTTTHFPTNNGTYSISDYNNKIREIANLMGCGLIEFDKDGITYENCYPTYISDSASAPTHPNTNGHRVMGEKAFADIKYCLKPTE